jgi:hypothetical protein
VPSGSARLVEQAAEALLRERRLGDLAAAVGGPQLVVDAPVGGEGRRRARESGRSQRQAECDALGLVEVEQRPVDVEEDGERAGQAYLAR